LSTTTSSLSLILLPGISLSAFAQRHLDDEAVVFVVIPASVGLDLH
jgi:hypothetical protein